ERGLVGEVAAGCYPGVEVPVVVRRRLIAAGRLAHRNLPGWISCVRPVSMGATIGTKSRTGRAWRGRRWRAVGTRASALARPAPGNGPGNCQCVVSLLDEPFCLLR